MPENGCGVVASTKTQTTEAAGIELPVPVWLDKSFLELAFGEHLRQTVHIRTFTVEPATAKGENFASAMYRVHATYTTKATTDNTDVCWF